MSGLSIYGRPNHLFSQSFRAFNLLVSLSSGAGESDGRTSWSGRPELGDFISFYGFILFYITGLKQRMRSSSSYPDIQDDPCRITGSEDRHPKLIIAGYSYGSVLATSLPAMDVMKRLFEPDKEGSSIATIKQEASRFSSLRHESVQTGTDQASEQVETADLTPITSVDVSYLLVSPVLPPVSFFAAMGLFSRSRLGTTVQGENIESPDAQQQLTQSKILSIYGDQDPFTSIKRLRKWTHDMQDVQGSLFKASEVKGAGHFWHGRAEELQMKKAIRDWITA